MNNGDMPLDGFFFDQAQAYEGFVGDRIFIETDCECLTFRDFEAKVNSFVKVLRRQLTPALLLSKEVVPVFVSVSNTWQSIAALFAVMRIGCAAIPIDAHLPENRVIELQRTFAVDYRVGVEFIEYWSQSLQDDYSQLKTQQDIKVLTEVSCDDLWRPCGEARLGIFTSGSSGSPKLVLHSHKSLLANASAANEFIPLQADDRTLLSLPLYHIGGFAQVLRSLLAQSTLVIAGRVESATVLSKFKITHTSMVATQLQRLLTCLDQALYLKAVLLGGGPVGEPLITLASDRGIPLYLTYGMTETASQLLTQRAPFYIYDNPDSCPHSEVSSSQLTGGLSKACESVIPASKNHQKIIGDTCITLTDDGELLVQGETLMLGYIHDHTFNSGRDEEGWYHTRDRAVKIGGEVKVIGRLDNQFVSGGKNIQPEEIEAKLQLLDSIIRAVVVPVPHPDFGWVPFAFLELSAGLQLDDDYIKDTVIELKNRLPGYLVPRHYAILPTVSKLKPQRKLLAVQAQNIYGLNAS